MCRYQDRMAQRPQETGATDIGGGYMSVAGGDFSVPEPLVLDEWAERMDAYLEPATTPLPTGTQVRWGAPEVFVVDNNEERSNDG